MPLVKNSSFVCNAYSADCFSMSYKPKEMYIFSFQTFFLFLHILANPIMLSDASKSAALLAIINK